MGEVCYRGQLSFSAVTNSIQPEKHRNVFFVRLHLIGPLPHGQNKQAADVICKSGSEKDVKNNVARCTKYLIIACAGMRESCDKQAPLCRARRF